MAWCRPRAERTYGVALQAIVETPTGIRISWKTLPQLMRAVFADWRPAQIAVHSDHMFGQFDRIHRRNRLRSDLQGSNKP